MADAMGSEQYRKVRQDKAAALRELGVEPFGQTFQVSHSIAAARAMAPEQVEAEQQPRGEVVRIAGRIGNLRKAGGKLMFGSLFDRSRADLYLQQRAEGVEDLEGAEAKKGRGIQLFLERGVLGDEQWAVLKKLDLADWIGVEGPIGRTKTGEISIFATQITVLGKSMLPPPHQAGASRDGLSAENRQRHRELDLMMSDGSLATFVTRSRIVTGLRRFFSDRGFLEVETPMMHTVLGGAAARPFETHHNALDIDLYLRIAPELHLKRLIVGGLDRVFELNRNFRNEGISVRHNPEFTMVEWYQAYADHCVMMDLTEELFRELADQVVGSRTLHFSGVTIDLNKPFRRYSYHDAMRELGGIAYDDKAAVEAKAREIGLDPADFATYDRLANEVWEEIVEPHLLEPTFITDQPTWLTPLCKAHPDDPAKTLRFELFVAKMEIGNAYSELNDPDAQRARFGEQLAEAEAAGDDEAGVAGGVVDQDYCTALDHGLPATGGQGLGIDRLVMLFTGASSIRDVILFPTMRP
ncbi:MAG: lysine--tRNA ligase [Planctomycetota bacterium]|jgi:lysyl-tRNA synthetase class 2|nr:lysine--tRNA ligase [Planctomycetota bacterium]